jgi:uncharacterized protein (TIGR00661 family)
MKILYAVQATGNGHISRACEILPVLKKRAHVDVLLSGNNSSLEPGFEVNYRSKGYSLYYQTGGIDYLRIARENNPLRLCKEIVELPVKNYDLVLSDFEPISAWACKLKHVPCISVSHQAAFKSLAVPQPEKSLLFNSIINLYAPASQNIGFHFKSYDTFIATPVIRKKIRQLEPNNFGHYTVYLPSSNKEQLTDRLSPLTNANWHVFLPGLTHYEKVRNIEFYPISEAAFIESLRSCAGIICGAGFELPAEALFLGKKLWVIPIKGQFEQRCNAYALELMGVKTSKSINEINTDAFEKWHSEFERIHLPFEDNTEAIFEKMLGAYECSGNFDLQLV